MTLYKITIYYHIIITTDNSRNLIIIIINVIILCKYIYSKGCDILKSKLAKFIDDENIIYSNGHTLENGGALLGKSCNFYIIV